MDSSHYYDIAKAINHTKGLIVNFTPEVDGIKLEQLNYRLKYLERLLKETKTNDQQL